MSKSREMLEAEIDDLEDDLTSAEMRVKGLEFLLSYAEQEISDLKQYIDDGLENSE